MAYIGSKPANKPVVASDLDPTVITGQTALATSPASTDEFLISDAGVLKRLDASLIGGGGKVLQVLTATDSTSRSTTSTSFVTASNTLSVDITPSATSSKILILCSGTTFQSSGTGHTGRITIYRDSTNLGGTNGFNLNGAYMPANTGGYIFSPFAINYLDSPSSTSEITYQVYINTQYASYACKINESDSKGSITVMEIGA